MSARKAAVSAAEVAVNAAVSIAEDIVEGRVSPAELDAEIAEQCRSLFARVAGPGDPLWELQVDVARQVLAVGGGIPGDEVAEWAAVTRRAEREAAGDAGVPAGSWIERALAELAAEDGDA